MTTTLESVEIQPAPCTPGNTEKDMFWSSPHTPTKSGLSLNTNRVNTLHMTSLAPNLHAVQRETATFLPSTPARISQHDVMPTADRFQPSIDPLRLREATECHPSKPPESRRTSLSQNITTAEAAKQALNAAFQSQSHVEHIHPSSSHKALHVKSANIRTAAGDRAVPASGSTSPRGSLKQIHGHHLSRDEHFQSKLAERTENNGAREKMVKFKHEKLLRNDLASESDSHGAHEQGSTQPIPMHDVTLEKDHSPRPTPKKYVFQAVVVDTKPPYRTGLVSPNRKISSSQQEFGVVKTGPPRHRDTARIRRQKVPEIRSEDELADILWANVANSRLASRKEFRQLENATLTNFEILMARWQSMEPVKDSPYSKIPVVGYHSSYPVETFIEGLEGAFGPDALSRIHQKVPKGGAPGRRNHSRYFVYTSSESEETEAEEVSDIPAEETQDEAIEENTTIEETAPTAAPDSIEDWTSENKACNGDTIIALPANGAEAPKTLKRKLSSEPEENSRKYPKLQDSPLDARFHRPGAWRIDKDLIAKWTAAIEVVVKGKVKLGRQDLRELREILDHIGNLGRTLKNDEQSLGLEMSRLKDRIRQLSEMVAEDIPFKDDEKLRQKASIISRSWI